MPFAEFTAIATVIYQTSDSYTNDPKARVIPTEEGADYTDWRGVQGQSRGSVAISDHGNLTGLGDDDHEQYPRVTGTRGFIGVVPGITPVLDAHLATKGYVDTQVDIAQHNDLEGLQGGDSTADEFYHLTQDIHDGLYSGSPIIGLGTVSVTNLEVDYGAHAITADSSGVNVFTLDASECRIGDVASDSLTFDRLTPEATMLVGSNEVMRLDAEDDEYRFGLPTLHFMVN